MANINNHVQEAKADQAFLYDAFKQKHPADVNLYSSLILQIFTSWSFAPVCGSNLRWPEMTVTAPPLMATMIAGATGTLSLPTTSPLWLAMAPGVNINNHVKEAKVE